MKELHEQMGNRLHLKIIDSSEYVMHVLYVEIQQIENAIKELLKANADLQTNYDLYTSVVGIGYATTVHFIIATENFTRFDEARKLVCYCGVALFKHEWGSSIRGKTRVSHLTGKKLKTLLTLAAVAAVRFDPSLKKIRAES